MRKNSSPKLNLYVEGVDSKVTAVASELTPFSVYWFNQFVGSVIALSDKCPLSPNTHLDAIQWVFGYFGAEAQHKWCGVLTRVVRMVSTI